MLNYISQIFNKRKNESNHIKSPIKSPVLLIVLGLFILRCDSFDYYLPSFKNFELCTKGFRVSIHTIEPYNESYGVRVYFRDQLEDVYYEVLISYFDHNFLPHFKSLEYRRLRRNEQPDEIKFMLEIDRPAEALNPNAKTKSKVFFHEFFYFIRSFNDEFYTLGGYTNELIGCPQVICLNAYFDAAYYDAFEKKYYLFRGSYYYSFAKKVDIFTRKLNLIQTKFFNVPSNVDSATFFNTSFYPHHYAIIFVKEKLVYLYTAHRKAAIEFNEREFFSMVGTSPQLGFINSLTDLSDRILVSRDNSFSLFVLAEPRDDIRFRLEGHVFAPEKTNGSINIEDADDSFSLVEDNKIFFIIRFKLYRYDLQQFKVIVQNAAANGKESKASFVLNKFEQFFDYFGCPASFYNNLYLEKSEFKSIYLDTLPNYHKENVWYKLISTVIPYDPTLIYITVGIISSFLIVAYILFFIFVAIYLSSSRRVELDAASRLGNEYTRTDTQMDQTSRSTAPDESMSRKPSGKKGHSTYSSVRQSIAKRFTRAMKAPQHDFQVIKLDQDTPTGTKQLTKVSESDYNPAFSDYNPLASKLTTENVKGDKPLTKGKQSSYPAFSDYNSLGSKVNSAYSDQPKVTDKSVSMKKRSFFRKLQS